MAAVKHAEQICFECLSKLLSRDFLHRLSENTHPCVIDQYVETAENTFALLHHHSDLVLAANVTDLTFGISVSPQVLEGAPQFPLIPSADHYVRTFAYELFRYCIPN